jgi:hypothetical protein
MRSDYTKVGKQAEAACDTSGDDQDRQTDQQRGWQTGNRSPSRASWHG